MHRLPARLAVVLLALAALAAPAAALADIAAPTGLKVEAYTTGATATWNGPETATDGSWVVYFRGGNGDLSVANKVHPKAALGKRKLDAVVEEGGDLTVLVAWCEEVGSSEVPSPSGDTIHVPCYPGRLGAWASKTVVRKSPPSEVIDASSRGFKVTWKVERPDPAVAAITGFRFRYRPDLCPAGSSDPRPCRHRARWRTIQLGPRARSQRIPGATHDSYWEVEIIPESEAGDGGSSTLGLYLS